MGGTTRDNTLTFTNGAGYYPAMAFLFSKAKWAIGRKKIDLQVDSIGIILVMSNSTVPSQEDVEFIAGLTTLDEYDGAGYSRKILANKSLAQDLVNNVARLTADDFSWAALGAGTRQCIGAILVQIVTNDTDSRPIAFIDGPAFPFNGDGQDKLWNWHDDGVLVIA